MASSLGKMPATSARRLISLTLELAWIDPEARCVRFSTTKSGAQLRDMGQPALELLLSQPCGRNGSPYVFPAERRRRTFHRRRAGPSAALPGRRAQGCQAARASAQRGRRHGLLTTAGLLGHTGRGVTQRHVRLDRALIEA